MTPQEASGGNAEQIKFWNEVGGPRWVRDQLALDAMLEPLGRIAIEALAIAGGERVLDVGCGCGATSIELARHVGQRGEVVGVDITAAMLDRARASAQSAGIANVRFIEADAQSYAFQPGEFDLLYSRFGVMFFADPRVAFTNLARAIRSGGRLAFVCWQSPQLNQWITVPMAAAAKHIKFTPPADPFAPGPFSFKDSERVRDVLSGAAFEDIAIEEKKTEITLGQPGATIEEATESMLDIGPVSAALREAGPEARPTVAAAVREALAPFQTSRGVRLGSALWLVTCRR